MVETELVGPGGAKSALHFAPAPGVGGQSRTGAGKLEGTFLPSQRAETDLRVQIRPGHCKDAATHPGGPLKMGRGASLPAGVGPRGESGAVLTGADEGPEAFDELITA